MSQTTMTQEALDHDKSIGLPLVPLDKIYADPIFNCRGYIAPMDVIDLAKDIAVRGLVAPITLRPRTKDTPKQFDYVVVAGHRRHMAYRVNQAPFIPAIIRPELADEFEARTVNAIENLKRSDLNMLQEAKTVSHYKNAHWSREEVAKTLGMSPGWVQVRFMILDLPEEIQTEVAAGFFNQTQIRDLYTLKDRSAQLSAAKQIKEAKERGENKVIKVIEKAKNPNSKKLRTKPEIFVMMDTIRSSLGGDSLVTRMGAWCAGEISTSEFYADLAAECQKLGKIFVEPKHENYTLSENLVSSDA